MTGHCDGSDGMDPTVMKCPLCKERLNINNLLMGREGKASHMCSWIEEDGEMEATFTITCPHCKDRFNMDVSSDLKEISLYYGSDGQGWKLRIWKRRDES